MTNIAISTLPAATALGSSDVFCIVQSSTTKKIPANAIFPVGGVTANTIATYNGITGNKLSSVPVTIDGTGHMAGVASLNITGLSGVMKATTGAVSGGATTSDMPEGSNLYFTNARAVNALKPGLTFTGPITLAADAVSALQPVTYEQLQAVASGFVFHSPCIAATTADLGTVSYNNGTAGVGATLTNGGTQAVLVVDGHTAVLNDRILVKNESNPAYNGIYDVTNIGSVSTNWVLTRSTDFDQSNSAEITPGAQIYITAGTANINTFWYESATGPFTIGTTAITFAVLNPPATYTAGNGISIGSNIISASINATNMQFTVGQINTIQDIATTSLVNFGGMNINSTTDPEAILNITQTNSFSVVARFKSAYFSNYAYIQIEENLGYKINFGITSVGGVDLRAINTIADDFVAFQVTHNNGGSPLLTQLGSGQITFGSNFANQPIYVCSQGTMAASISNQHIGAMGVSDFTFNVNGQGGVIGASLFADGTTCATVGILEVYAGVLVRDFVGSCNSAFSIITETQPVYFGGNVGITFSNFGNCQNVFGMGVANFEPNFNPSSGVLMWYYGGQLKVKGPSGNVVTIATT